MSVNALIANFPVAKAESPKTLMLIESIAQLPAY
jgi:hypothetical protein